MTTRAQRRDTRPPRTGPGERDVALGFLDMLRGAVLAKADGVPEPAVRTPGVPSGTSLLGLVKHLTHVERAYFQAERVPDWPATFRPGPDETAAGLLDAYRAAVAASNAVITGYDDLSRPAPGGGTRPSMRWLLTHMIEETGRHAGHADILRELTDGSTGR